MNVVELLGLPTLEDQLQGLEPLLVESVITGDTFLDEVTTHLLAAGGKRLRPSLALATATSGARPATREDLLGGVAVELVHLASLYHDDVMDEATMRRNVESVNARFGNLIAIVAGDFLLARSAEIAAGLGTEIAGLLAATLGRLCQGQIAEVRSAFQKNRTREEYTETIACKTASLMATSCRIGALTGGLPREQVEAYTEFGRYFGMIFQVRDDVLDVVGTEAELGKQAGTGPGRRRLHPSGAARARRPGRRPRAQPVARRTAGPARTRQGPVDRRGVRRHRAVRAGGEGVRAAGRRRGRGGVEGPLAQRFRHSRPLDGRRHPRRVSSPAGAASARLRDEPLQVEVLEPDGSDTWHLASIAWEALVSLSFS